MRSNGGTAMHHIRLLSRLHCAILRARSHVQITAITAFSRSLMLNKRGSLHLSDAASSLSAVIPEVLVAGPVSVYLKAQRSLLMRHMRMGISMDIIMVACCFILALSSPQ